MTSMPASRKARAITLAPRSCPSRPGLATRTRILRSIREFAITFTLTTTIRRVPDRFRKLRAVHRRSHRELRTHALLLVYRALCFLVRRRRRVAMTALLPPASDRGG